MVINVEQISEDEGLNLHHVYPTGEPRLRGEESRLVGEPEVGLQAMRAGRKVKIAGQLSAQVEIDCDRCLKPITVPISQSFDLSYIPPAGAGQEHELADDDLSTAFYDGETIDVDDLVREQVELALPMVRLCGEGCRGLCPDCGANLNEGQCGCAAQGSDPRWAALKNIRPTDEL